MENMTQLRNQKLGRGWPKEQEHLRRQSFLHYYSQDRVGLWPGSVIPNVLQMKAADLLLVVLGQVAEALAAQEEDGHLVERLARTHVVVLFQ